MKILRPLLHLTDASRCLQIGLMVIFKFLGKLLKSKSFRNKYFGATSLKNQTYERGNPNVRSNVLFFLNGINLSDP
jgi:hypothetical protein